MPTAPAITAGITRETERTATPSCSPYRTLRLADRPKRSASSQTFGETSPSFVHKRTTVARVTART